MASMDRATNVLQWMITKKKQRREPEQIFKNILKFEILSATRECEDGIVSNRGSARHGE